MASNNELAPRARRSFTRLTRFINQLMREQMACGPVTVQQCYALEALVDGPLSMSVLASDVALHQSTLTRVVGKLEHQGLVRRGRRPGDQRTVLVELTSAGRDTYAALDSECMKLIDGVLAMLPRRDRATIVESMEALADVLGNQQCRALLADCCGGSVQGDAA